MNKRIATSITIILLLVLQASPILRAEREQDGKITCEKGDDNGIDWVTPSDYALLDPDGNGRFNELVVNLTLSEPASEDITLSISLSASRNAPDDPGIRRVQTISKGEKKISIEFPGTDIYRKRLNFPCFLLVDLIDSNEKTNSTILRLEGEYTYNNFESPFSCGFYDFIEHGGSVTNTGGSIGADTDKNDLYDLLEIKLSAFTKVPGNYSVVGDLRPSLQTVQAKELSYTKEADITRAGDSNGASTDNSGSASDNSGAEDDNSGSASDNSRAGDDNSGSASDNSGARDNSTEAGDNSTGTVNKTHGLTDAERYYPGILKIPIGENIASSVMNFHSSSSKEEKVPVILKFKGTRIHSSHWDGPFILTASIFHENAFVDSIEWMLLGYRHTQFKAPAVYGFLTGNYTLEWKREGYLLTVEVTVLRKDCFILTGEIFQNYESIGSFDEDIEFNPVSMKKELSPGTNKISILFKGEKFLYGSKIYLTLTTRSTGGEDHREIMVGEKQSPVPQPNDPLVIKKAFFKDNGMDTRGDKKYEYLGVKLIPEIPSGNYDGHALLFSMKENIERVIAKVSGKFYDNNDNARIKEFSFLFPGDDIYLSGIDGPYKVEIYLTAENGTIYRYRDTTGKYSSTDFSPLGGREEEGPEPAYKMTNNSLFVHTDVFASEILKNSPELSFFYYTDMGESVRFRVRYSRLIAFNDDGDGIYEEGEEAYQAYLTTKNWKMSPVVYGTDRRMGSYLSFNMSTVINMEAVSSGNNVVGVRDWGILALHFLLANNTVNETNLKIRGGEELKITVEITPLRPLLVNAIALEQIIFTEKDGIFVQTPRGPTKMNVPLDEIQWNPASNTASGNTSALSFEKSNGEEIGYYSWENRAILRLTDGSSKEIEVGSSVTMENNSLTLYLSYPICPGMKNVEHDPAVGVFGENAPLLKKIREETSSPEGYLMGILIAGMLVIATLYHRGPKKRKEKL